MILRRRIITIPRSIALFALTTLLLPVLFVTAAVVDAVRGAVQGRPWMATRMLAFGWLFQAVEIWGLLRFAGHWLAAGFGTRRRWMVDRAWGVQAWWARTLFGAVRRLFRLEVTVEGEDAATPGPIIAMFRHASIIDNLLPAVFLTDRHGLRLRWIIKRELLAVPSLDVGGTRLPNHFVDRSGADPRTELRSIRGLTADLGPSEGVLIFPEGTRFTEKRRQRALAGLAGRDPHLHSRALRLRHLLPPRIGGPLTLLDAGYDVVFCAHEGLGGFAKVKDLWSGALVGGTINIRFWRVSAADVPSGRTQRIDWLFDRWEALDQWIADTKRSALTLPAT